MTRSTTKPATAKTATAKAAAATGKPSIVDQAIARYHASTQELLAALNAPTFARVAVACIAGLVVYASGVYAALHLVELLVVGTAVLTGSAFLSFVVMVVTAFLTGYAAALAGMKVFEFIRDLDVKALRNTGSEIRAAAVKRVSLARQWFKREDTVDAAIVAAR